MVLWCPVSCNIPYVFLFINAKVIVQFHAKCLVVFFVFLRKRIFSNLVILRKIYHHLIAPFISLMNIIHAKCGHNLMMKRIVMILSKHSILDIFFIVNVQATTRIIFIQPCQRNMITSDIFMAPLHEKRLILFYISVSWFVGQSVEQVLSNQYPNGPFQGQTDFRFITQVLWRKCLGLRIKLF